MAPNQRPYQDKQLLYKLYHGENLTKKEIADKLYCSDVTIGNWMDKFGIPDHKAFEYKDYLKSMYVDKEMTQKEIANIFDVYQSTIGRVLERKGIESRGRGDYYKLPIHYNKDGYLVCRHRHRNAEGEKQRSAVFLHRLVAVAEYGFDAVVDKNVHHKNNHQADNRPDNLEPLTPSEHAKLHHSNKDVLDSYGE